MTAGVVFAARQIGVGMEAFNHTLQGQPEKTAVFSPISLEVDCALFAESLDTISKAGVSETMGVVIDFESTYRPVMDELMTGTNGLSLTAARGFCIPEIKLSLPAHRQFLERAYGAEVMRLHPRQGAEAWFRAQMDGEMEGFEIDSDLSNAHSFCFYDLVSVRISWQDSFPAADTRRGAFVTAAGVTNEVEYLSDTREVDTWETKEFSLLRLPLGSGMWFYAMLPAPGISLARLRDAIGPSRIDLVLTVTKSLVEKGVWHGPCQVVLPKIDVTSRLDLRPALSRLRVPQQGLVHVAGECSARECVQYARFRLDEGVRMRTSSAEEKKEPGTAARLGEPKRMAFDRPFVFFVHHEGTASVPVAGQFCGD